MRSHHMMPSTNAYNAVILAHVNVGRWKDAYFFLEAMQNDNVIADEYTYQLALSAAAIAGDFDRVKTLQRDIELHGVDVGDIMITAAVRACQYEQFNDHLFSTETESSDLALAVMTIHSKAARFSQTLEVLRWMGNKYKPNIKHYNAAIFANRFGESHWQQCLLLVREARARGLEPDDNTHHAVLLTLRHAGRVVESLELMKELTATGALPSTRTLAVAMSTCGDLGRFRCALQLMREMASKGVHLNEDVYCGAIRACGEGKHYEGVLLLLREMLDSDVDHFDEAFHAALAAYSKGGQWQQAIKVLRLMDADGVAASAEAYASIIAACSKWGRWQEAVALLREMEDKQMIVHDDTHHLAVLACEKASRWDEALDLLRARSKVDNGGSGGPGGLDVTSLDAPAKGNHVPDVWMEIFWVPIDYLHKEIDTFTAMGIEASPLSLLCTLRHHTQALRRNGDADLEERIGAIHCGSIVIPSWNMVVPISSNMIRWAQRRTFSDDDAAYFMPTHDDLRSEKSDEKVAKVFLCAFLAADAPQMHPTPSQLSKSVHSKVVVDDATSPRVLGPRHIHEQSAARGWEQHDQRRDRPVHEQRLSALRCALADLGISLDDATAGPVHGASDNELLLRPGSPAARVFRSFVAPRPRALKAAQNEPLERSARRTAEQINALLRQMRAEDLAFPLVDSPSSSSSSLSGHASHVQSAAITCPPQAPPTNATRHVAGYVAGHDELPTDVATTLVAEHRVGVGSAEGESTLRPSSPRSTHSVILVLDNIRSVFNVGSMFRTAETCAVEELLTVGITAHPPHPKLRKTALAALSLVPWRHFDDIMDAIAYLRSKNFTIVALEMNPRSKVYSEIRYPQQVALIVGNEVSGVEPRTMDAVDVVAEIPTFGVRNSLNVASAAPVVLFEVLRQWREGAPH